ncbi:hypothetical protein [Novosphingobium sp. KN65.2]|uniref:hypothetical protein n=1 Tax=Novosphingobium sp. KN65.2 TaxID=1478134 RepID=UPI0005E97DA2|nr:hypothetical protein [Novosphingobium sp. KN65.2]CDO37633.1 conserved hypothetical protein [Novosphingobium sp. KN65.2]
MADKGIIFSAPMIRALLDGRKTQTRRLCAWANNPNSPALSYIVACDEPGWFGDEEGEVQFRVPYAPGDRLYVREAHYFNHYEYADRRAPKERPADLTDEYICYCATEDDCEIQNEARWRPSIHMPRWASRMFLAVTDVRVQRLQEISEDDAIAEGIEPVDYQGDRGWKSYETYPDGSPHPHATVPNRLARRSFEELWNSLHTTEGERWDDNPWIVAVSFDVHHRNIDAEKAA